MTDDDNDYLFNIFGYGIYLGGIDLDDFCDEVCTEDICDDDDEPCLETCEDICKSPTCAEACGGGNDDDEACGACIRGGR